MTDGQSDRRTEICVLYHVTDGQGDRQMEICVLYRVTDGQTDGDMCVPDLRSPAARSSGCCRGSCIV